PRKTINELRKLLDEGAADLEVSLSDTRIQFQAGPVLLTSKLIDGTFPEYERVIPKGNDRILRVGKRDFAAAVGRVAAISQERSRPVKLSITQNMLNLSATSPDQGVAHEELDENAVSYDAAPIEIGFQARYLTDITDQIDVEVEFAFSDSSAPTIVRDTASPSALYVLMPMRV
ncbi:DNA polymerase III subunit beta, partial [Gluconobacter oxydans]